jgi:hypothetical protein
MNCFNYIAKKLTNVDKVDNVCNDDLLLQINFEIFLNMKYSIEKKFTYYDNVNKNKFFTREQCNGFNQTFYDIQKACTGFNKLAHIYKYKKAPTIVDTDICLNKINITDKNVICIYQNNFKYLFNVLDLIKITNHALTHSESFYSDPKPLKNPYNNMYFNKSTLYNIYFYIKYNTNLYSDLFFKFFDVHFNLAEFNIKYEHILREHSIENYVNRSSASILFVETLRMFSGYNYRQKNKFVIDSNFPKEILVKIMKPYLLLHMQSLHSLVNATKMHASSTLTQKLLALHSFNPNFGKKIMYPVTKRRFGKPKVTYKPYFNDKHIPFHKHSNDFLSSHTTLNFEYNDENEMPQIMNTFEYTIFNVEVFANEIEEYEDEGGGEDEEDDEEDGETVIDDNVVPNGALIVDENDTDSEEADDNSVS